MLKQAIEMYRNKIVVPNGDADTYVALRWREKDSGRGADAGCVVLHMVLVVLKLTVDALRASPCKAWI